jgi:hypothetical protein
MIKIVQYTPMAPMVIVTNDSGESTLMKWDSNVKAWSFGRCNERSTNEALVGDWIAVSGSQPINDALPPADKRVLIVYRDLNADEENDTLLITWKMFRELETWCKVNPSNVIIALCVGDELFHSVSHRFDYKGGK